MAHLQTSIALGNQIDNSQCPVVSNTLTRCDIFRNVGIICFSFFLSFSAFNATVSLQTSLYPYQSLGSKGLIMLSLVSVLSNLFLAMYMTRKLGLKWSLFLCLATHVTFPAVNLYPNIYTLFLGATITGLGAGPLWNAKSTYLTLLGEHLSDLVEGSAEASISLFFGIFYMAYYAAAVAGNLISSSVLKRPRRTVQFSSAILKEFCAARFCYEDLDTVFSTFPSKASLDEFHSSGNESYLFNDKQSYAINTSASFSSEFSFQFHPLPSLVVTLFVVFSLCSLLSSPPIFFLSTMQPTASERSKDIWPTILAMFCHVKQLKEMMMMPLALFSGISYAFITGDYCVGFVTCIAGIDHIGYMMGTFGVVAGICAISFGPLTKFTGRRAIFIFGALLNVAILVAMFMWLPTSEGILVLYTFAGFWGMTHVIWTSQYMAFVGYVFRSGNTEAAFACNYMWQMIGTCLWYSFSVYFCIYIQIFIMIFVLVVGMLGYLVVEIILKKERVGN